MREAKSNVVRNAAVHYLWDTLFTFFKFCVPHSLLLFFHSVTVHSPSHFRFVKVGCQFLSFIRIVLKFLVSVLLQIFNTFLFHQKHLKNWANRMVTDGTTALYILCLLLCLSVHMCVLGCRGVKNRRRVRKNSHSLQSKWWLEKNSPYLNKPPSPSSVWDEVGFDDMYETIPIPRSKTYLWESLKPNDYMIMLWGDSHSPLPFLFFF